MDALGKRDWLRYGVSLYLVLKYMHILLAVVAIGLNVSYPVWFARARKQPEHALSILQGIKFLDDRFANPAYGLLLVLGIALVITGGIPWTTFWIDAALVLYVLLLIGGGALYSPTLKRQIAALQDKGIESAEFARLDRRSTLVGSILMVDVLLIVALMVLKPSF